MTCIRTMGGEGVNFILKDVKKVKEFIVIIIFLIILVLV